MVRRLALIAALAALAAAPAACGGSSGAGAGPGLDAAPAADAADASGATDSAAPGDADLDDADLDPGGSDAAADLAPELPAPPDLPEVPLDLAVATFNVARFFDTTCDSGQCGKLDFEEQPSAGQFAARVDELAAAIEALDADVVLLQEVETQGALDALHARLDGARWPIALVGETGAPGSVDTAILAGGELVEVRTHRQYSIPRPGGGWTTFTRELLEVHLDMGGWRVVTLCAHFKSKFQDEPERRLAEAAAARGIALAVAAELPDALVVLGGDLNDVPGSEALGLVEEGGELVRAAADMAPGTDWTFLYDGAPLALDHLYVATPARGAYVPGTALVIRDPGAGGLGGSDHAAVRARFALAPE